MDERICPYCGQSSKTVFVHGHEQCVCCKMNIKPCCEGGRDFREGKREEDWKPKYHKKIERHLPKNDWSL